MEFVDDLYTKFYDDEEIRTILYHVDRGDDEEIRFLGELEKEADKTIKYLEYLGRLLKREKLYKEDIDSFKYEIKRIVNSPRIKEYVEWLRSINGISDGYRYLEEKYSD